MYADAVVHHERTAYTKAQSLSRTNVNSSKTATVEEQDASFEEKIDDIMPGDSYQSIQKEFFVETDKSADDFFMTEWLQTMEEMDGDAIGSASFHRLYRPSKGTLGVHQC